MKTWKVVLGVSVMLFAGSLESFAAKATDNNGMNGIGSRLFKNYGCSNCHGIDGASPSYSAAPVLRGKNRDYLYNSAVSIFAGKRNTENASIMHDQYCHDDDNETACESAPGSDELLIIARWLDTGYTLAKKKRTPQKLYVTAKEAHNMLYSQAEQSLFVDVRTRAEAAFVGVPVGIDAHIPFMVVGSWNGLDERNGKIKLHANSKFFSAFEKALGSKGLKKDDRVILICRSGSRSAKAARVLHIAGYKNVYTVIDGFEGDKKKDGMNKGQRVVNGWKNSDLPWSYKLPSEKLAWDIP
ncbi:MAG: rhodanese-like domain-containing protein [Sedimenticola sp.]